MVEILLEPKVQLFSAPTFFPIEDFPIPDDGTDAEKIGAFAAKTCYASKGKNGRANKKNQKQVMQNQHGSVLEHINFGLFITGISRGLTLELNRHRPLSISQRSTRYVEEENGNLVLEPFEADLWKKYVIGSTSREMLYDDYTYRGAILQYVEGTPLPVIFYLDKLVSTFYGALDSYALAVSTLESPELRKKDKSGTELRKWARGKARGRLPNNLETQGCWTGNIRAWRWFCESRSERHAEDEIRKLAGKVFDVLEPFGPLYWEDFEKIDTNDGLTEYVPKFHKV